MALAQEARPVQYPPNHDYYTNISPGTGQTASSKVGPQPPEGIVSSIQERLPGLVQVQLPEVDLRPSTKWSFKPCAGIIHDIKARAPFYVSDWTDAYNYRVIPSTALIFFANVLPGIAFSLDLIETTGQYGVVEVLMASFIAAFIFSIFGAQPLCIAGVTGPITVLNKTIYDILNKSDNPPNYLQFIAWTYLWGAIFHWIAAVSNAANFLRYVTRFACDTFGFYVSWVYIQYGVQVLTRQFEHSTVEAAYVSIILSLLVLLTSYLFLMASYSTYFHRVVRRFFADYGMPITIVAASTIAYWGRFNTSNAPTLPTAGAFQAAQGREWLVKFWQLEGKWVGIAMPFGFILFILFFFDHQVSSLMAQGSEFPLRKPPGFHWDFALLGICTFIAGILGVPAPNGLIPQAPIHTRSLVVMGYPKKSDIEVFSGSGTVTAVSRDEKKLDVAGEARKDELGRKCAGEIEHPPLVVNEEQISKRLVEVPVAVVEQRVSNLVQGSLCLILMTGPLLHVLGLIPRGVLAGLFFSMGTEGVLTSGVTSKALYLMQDRKLVDGEKEPLRKVRKSRIWLFLAIELIGFGATMAITQTIAAIGFPIIIALLIPVRTYVIPKLSFTLEELAILDQPTASAFTMHSVGGSI